MSDVDQHRHYYQERWASFEHPNALDLQRVAKVLEYLAHAPARHDICDLGCGAGWSTAVLGHFGRAVGIELSDVQRQREHYSHCEFISADILNWDYPPTSFDVIASIEVMEHIPYQSQALYLHVAHRLLRDHGHLILTTPNKRTLQAMVDGGRAWSNQPIEDWLTMRELIALLEKNGFAVLRRSSLILGHGTQGSYRVVNSSKIAAVAKSIGMLNLWQDLALSLNYGLHLCVLAQKRSP